MIFFVDPNEEVFGFIVPDTTSVWPVTGHTSTGEEWGDWSVKEEMISDKLILFLVSHGCKRIVFALEFTIEFGKRFSR
jgi:hypothetical protein